MISSNTFVSIVAEMVPRRRSNPAALCGETVEDDFVVLGDGAVVDDLHKLLNTTYMVKLVAQIGDCEQWQA